MNPIVLYIALCGALAVIYWLWCDRAYWRGHALDLEAAQRPSRRHVPPLEAFPATPPPEWAYGDDKIDGDGSVDQRRRGPGPAPALSCTPVPAEPWPDPDPEDRCVGGLGWMVDPTDDTLAVDRPEMPPIPPVDFGRAGPLVSTTDTTRLWLTFAEPPPVDPPDEEGIHTSEGPPDIDGPTERPTGHVPPTGRVREDGPYRPAPLPPFTTFAWAVPM